MIDPNDMTSNKALQIASNAVTLVRDGNPTNEQLKEIVVDLSAIIAYAVEVITAMQLAYVYPQDVDAEGCEVPGKEDMN
jgi:hypothetical protein